MKSLLISIVAVTFLGAAGTALATSSRGEAPPLGMQKHLEHRLSFRARYLHYAGRNNPLTGPVKPVQIIPIGRL